MHNEIAINYVFRPFFAIRSVSDSRKEHSLVVIRLFSAADASFPAQSAC